MNPIDSWLDPTEVRRLAERLMWQSPEPAAIVTDAGFNDAFVGFAIAAPATPAAPAARVAPVAPAPPAQPTPTFQASPVPPIAAAETPPAASIPFLETFARLRNCIHQHHAVTGIFILDQEGSVIFEDSPHSRLHFLAKSLVLAPRQQGASAGNVRVKIAAGVTLEVIPVDTPRGRLVLGAVVPHALPPDAITTVIQELKQVALQPSFR